MKVSFADKERELRAWAAGLKQRRPEVARVGLFGSYATDTYGPRSDADVLILLRASDRVFRDRIPDFLPAGLSVPCDVFPYTLDEIAKRERDESPWIKHILQEVVWL